VIQSLSPIRPLLLRIARGAAAMPYNLAVIRELILAAFGDEEFLIFCADHFPAVRQQFTTGQTQGQRVLALVEHADRHGLLDQLLAHVKAANAYQYTRFAPGIIIGAPPSPPAAALAPPTPQHTVFISYSHKDEAWKDRLLTHLGVLQSQGLLELWDDRRIAAGEDWYAAIQAAMRRASVAVLLISADFLTSKFILGEEVPRLLARRDAEGVRVIPLIVRPCAWQVVPWLRRLQARPRDGRPLSAGSESQVDADLAALAVELYELLQRGSA
jgi:hypothetical protein